MRRGVLWDSSAILALLDADDDDHERALATADRIVTERRPSFVTNYIEVEAHALLLRKLGRAMARQWLLAGGDATGLARYGDSAKTSISSRRAATSRRSS